jgi:hypothetical protein
MILCDKGSHNQYVSFSHLENPNVNVISYENGFSLSEASGKGQNSKVRVKLSLCLSN